MKIRRATVKDVVDYCGMTLQMLQEEGSDVPVKTDPTQVMWADSYEALNDPNTHVLLAVDDEDKVTMGMLAFTVSDRPRIFMKHAIVDGLYVRKPFRSQGVVFALIRAAKAIGREMGIRYVVTQARGKNEDRAYYERIGWRKSSVVLTMDLEG